MAPPGHLQPGRVPVRPEPRSVGDPVRVASRLAPLLGTAEIELHSLLTSSRPFVWIHRRLPPSTAAAVKALREPGLGFLPEPLRLYPNRELAAHVVGFEGVDGGLEGIERALEETLRGASRARRWWAGTRSGERWSPRRCCSARLPATA